jgi:pimeloyl-ACP methyl ester carboxylesterase
MQLSDGRQLGYACYGASGGPAVFYFHGLPGSRREGVLLDEPARTLGVQVIAVDRPGFGLSSVQPRRSLSDWPLDVTQLADALSIDRFALLGVSGGGPYVLACAHRMPARVVAVGVVCGLGPVADRALWRDMPWLLRTVFTLARTQPALLNMLYGQPVAWMARTNNTLPLQWLAHITGEPDRSVMLNSETFSALMENFKESFRQGSRGAEYDLRLLGGIWGFPLQEIGSAVHLWHGDADTLVPKRHSEYLQGCLPNAQLSIVPGEGHYSLPIRYRAQVLQTIVEAARW